MAKSKTSGSYPAPTTGGSGSGVGRLEKAGGGNKPKAKKVK